jgi:hypothetical protein
MALGLARDAADTWSEMAAEVGLGDVASVLGDLAEAVGRYTAAMELVAARAARDPANAEWQRDLIVSHVKLSEASGDAVHVLAALQIAERMQKRGILAPRDAWMIEDLRRRAAQ